MKFTDVYIQRPVLASVISLLILVVGLRAITALGVVGFGIALLFTFFAAPDLAITQFLVETLLVILLALVLALSGSFVQLAMLSVIARLTTYICTAAAVPVLRRRGLNAQFRLSLRCRRIDVDQSGERVG